jgi:hypothetical protein
VKLSQSEKQAINIYFKILSRSDVGKIYLVNIYQAIKYKKIEKETLINILLEWIGTGAKRSEELIDALIKICENNFDYLCSLNLKPNAIDKHQQYSTTLDAIMFHRFVLSKTNNFLMQIPDFGPKCKTHFDEVNYNEQIKRITSYPDWYDKKGYLGKPSPFPKLIWFTDNDILNKELLNDPDSESNATKTRDILGLFLIPKNRFLIKVVFPGSILTEDPKGKVARPLFTDLITKRFVFCLGKDNCHHYQANWGVTVNLKKMANNHPNIYGVPERISTPLQLSRIGSRLRINCLGFTGCTRGSVKDIDDDKKFYQLISFKKSTNFQINKIIEYIE